MSVLAEPRQVTVSLDYFYCYVQFCIGYGRDI
jgi:hypothetical protein